MKGKVLSYLLAIYCILMPFEEALAYGFGSILKIFGFLIIGFIIINYRFNLLKSYERPLIIWMIYMLVSVIWTPSIEIWSDTIIIYIGQLLLLIAIDNVKVDDFDMNIINYGLIATALIASIILYAFPSNSMYTEDGRRSIMLGAGKLDPNIVASTIVLGLHIAINGIFKSKKKLYLLLWSGASLMMLYGVFVTGSRGALLAFIASFILKMLFESKESPTARKRIILISAIGIVALPTVFSLVPEEIIGGRFSMDAIFGQDEYLNGSHNRYAIWLASIILIANNPIFGYGCASFMPKITTVYPMKCASHNLYILLLVEGGIIGLFLFMKYIIRLLKDLRRQKDYLTYSVVISTLIISMSLDAIPYKFFWITLIYALISKKKNDLRLKTNYCS